ncbi:hypothetical protein HYZ98_00565, partial [Candidatus Peregrinibacteria bacterium]|nr:hypothetical protein [Candidatus Peregrinibacteria bacterium]
MQAYLSRQSVCSRLSGLLFGLLLLFSATVAEAAERHWIGSDSAADKTAWLTPANWSATKGGASANAVPTYEDKVTFDTGGGDVNVAGIAKMASLTLAATWTGSVNVGTGWLVVKGQGISVQSGRLLSTSAGIVTTTGSYIQTGGVVTMKQLSLSGALSITRGGKGADNLYFTSTGTILFNHATADQTFTVQRTVTGTIAFSGITL